MSKGRLVKKTGKESTGTGRLRKRVPERKLRRDRYA